MDGVKHFAISVILLHGQWQGKKADDDQGVSAEFDCKADVAGGIFRGEKPHQSNPRQRDTCSDNPPPLAFLPEHYFSRVQ